MAIASSSVTLDRAQADGRRRIFERHVDDAGGAHWVYVLVPADWAAEDYLPTRAAQIEARLAAQEIEANLSEIAGG